MVNKVHYGLCESSEYTKRSWLWRGYLKKSSIGSTNHINHSGDLRRHRIKIWISCQSLESVAADPGKQFLCLNIVFNNNTGPFVWNSTDEEKHFSIYKKDSKWTRWSGHFIHDIKYINIKFINIGNRKKTTLSSRQACFVIAQSSGDLMIIRIFKTIGYILFSLRSLRYCVDARLKEHGSAAKTLISHPHNTASYAG